MKAHIYKNGTDKQQAGIYLSISDNKISGHISYEHLGKFGKLAFRGWIAIDCDVDTRVFEVESLDFTSLQVTIGDDVPAQWDKTLYIDDDSRLLINQASLAVLKVINDNKEYLLDNHHDWFMSVNSTSEEIEFSNKSAQGFFCLTDDKANQEAFDASDELVDYYEVGFLADYEICMVGKNQDKLELKNIKVSIGDYDHFTVAGDKIASTQGTRSDLDDTLVVDLEHRIAAGIAEKFAAVEYHALCVLKGTEA